MTHREKHLNLITWELHEEISQQFINMLSGVDEGY